MDWLFGIHNYSIFDSYWVGVHYSSGVLIGLFLLRYYSSRNRPVSRRKYARYGFALLLFWEYCEIGFRLMEKKQVRIVSYLDRVLPHGFFQIESLINIAGDLIIGSLGLYLAYSYYKYKRRAEQVTAEVEA